MTRGRGGSGAEVSEFHMFYECKNVFTDKRACWITWGGGAGTHLKINYKALNEISYVISQHFFRK